MKRSEQFPLAIERQYLRAIDRFLNDIDKDVMASVRKNVNIREKKADAISDVVAFVNKMQQDFERKEFLKKIEKSTNNIMKSVKNFSNRLLKNRFKSFFKLQPNTSDFEIPALTDRDIEGVVKQNVELIKTVGKEYLSTIQVRIEENIKEGGSQKELAELLEKDTKVERNRARFWASDQLGKAYGQVTKKSHAQAAIEKFIWRTQLDQRVRDSHLSLEGKEFDWDNPPIVDGRQIIPGEDFNCRCFSEPVIE